MKKTNDELWQLIHDEIGFGISTTPDEDGSLREQCIELLREHASATRSAIAPGPEFRSSLLQAAGLAMELGVGAESVDRRLERKREMIARSNARGDSTSQLIYLAEVVGLEALRHAIGGVAPNPPPKEVRVDALADELLFAERDGRASASPEPVELTKGLLDALVLTPWGPPPLTKLLAGERPEVTHVGVEVKGLPGFRATIQAAACRELQVALEALLGPQRPEELLVMTPVGPRTVEDLVDRMVEVLRLVEEAEARLAANFPGETQDPGIRCVKIREVLGRPRSSP